MKTLKEFNYLVPQTVAEAASMLAKYKEEASKEGWSYTEFLGKLLEEEMSARQERRLTIKQRLARFGGK
jgi:DNA replication protein DnaC